jgi:sugar lactone lactonase YvrE
LGLSWSAPRAAAQAASPPTIVLQSGSETVIAGQPVSFSIGITSDLIPSYQWQESTDGGTTWTNLSDGGEFIGSATTTLAIGATTPSMTGAKFQAVVTNFAGSASSAPVTLTVTPLPSGDSTEYAITTYAGLAPGFVNGSGSLARFSEPDGIAVDGAGNVYVADTANNAIRKVTASGVVTTLAGGGNGSSDGVGTEAQFNQPWGLALDASGNLYVADSNNNSIRVVSPAGSVTTLAGGSYGSADGTGLAAKFEVPKGVAVDGSGNVYVADTYNNTIRMITPAGVVTTLAGSPGQAGTADGTGSAARFNDPAGVAIGPAGVLYVADSNNRTVREVTTGGVVTTLAGDPGVGGYADGMAEDALFGNFGALTVDGAGNVYVADTSNNKIRMVTPAGVVTTLAGGTSQNGNGIGNADGTGSSAHFNNPAGITIDGTGTLWVADSGNNTIRKVTVSSGVGAATTLAGTSGVGSADGPASAAQFNDPNSVAVDSAGNVYVADTYNSTIRKVTPSGQVTTLAGTAWRIGSSDGTGSAAEFALPGWVAVDLLGNVYVSDSENYTIRKITPAGVVTTLAGRPNYSSVGLSGNVDGLGSAALFSYPQGLAVDSAGNVYVADQNACTIRKVTPSGMVTTLAGSLNQPGSADGTGSAARFFYPIAVAVDSAGNVYVADNANNSIREVSAAGVVTTLYDASTTASYLDVQGSEDSLGYPNGVALDASGNLFVSDLSSTIWRFSPKGAIAVIAGYARQSGSLDGIGTAARFESPHGMAVDGSGRIYIADEFNDTIRVAVPLLVGPPVVATQPQGVTVNPGQNATFSTAGNSIPQPTFEWEVSTDGGTSWTLLADGNGVTGSQTAVLTLSGVTRGMNGYLYECLLSNNLGTATSQAAALTVNPPPSIVSQPVSQTVYAGSGVVLTVEATSSAPATYQWYFNGNPMNGDTGTTVTLLNVTAANAGTYVVAVTNSVGTTSSNGATLTVSPSPGSSIITTQPVSQVIGLGGSVVFTVQANGSVQSSLRAATARLSPEAASGTTHYQWQFNGVNLADGNGISGSSGPQLVIQGAAPANDGDYACIVTTASGSVMSNTAGLQVEAASTPGIVSSISSRAFVGTGDNVLIGGFYVAGSTSATVLVQAIGPSLAPPPYNVSGTLKNPVLTIHQTQNGKDVVLYSNAGWGSSPVLLAAAAAAYAQPVLQPGSNDSELLLTLPPGGYTAEVAGVDEGTGVALCAIYQIP